LNYFFYKFPYISNDFLSLIFLINKEN
jgi:hypothetical protein